MTLRYAQLVGLVLVALVAPVGAWAEAPVKAGAAGKANAVASGKAAAAKPGAPAIGRSGAALRTLDDIHIEGEIPVPQVLFITARDQRRFMEFQHQRYLRTSRKLGEDTALPSRIVVTRNHPTPAKETPR